MEEGDRRGGGGGMEERERERERERQKRGEIHVDLHAIHMYLSIYTVCLPMVSYVGVAK